MELPHLSTSVGRCCFLERKTPVIAEGASWIQAREGEPESTGDGRALVPRVGRGANSQQHALVESQISTPQCK